MLDFFTDLFQKLHILTGVDMNSFLTDDERALLLLQLVQCGEQDPYNHITDTVKQRIIMDNIYKDESLVRPPYGCKPGLNRRILTKWYRQHWELHGTTIARKAETTTDDDQYKKYVTWAKANNLEVIPKDRQATDEKVKEYISQIGRHMLDNQPAPSGPVDELLQTVHDIATALHMGETEIHMLQRYYLRMKFNHLTLHKIAQLTGVMHHTTVMHSIEAVSMEPRFALVRKEIDQVLSEEVNA